MLATGAALSLGCSSEYRVDGGAPPDGSAPMGVIELESEPSLTLSFGEEAELAVRYVESGVAVRGVPIRFALEGRAHDSTVADLSVETDAEGRARTRMVAGSTASAFRLRVSAERAAPVYVNVSVGNMGFGALVVRAEYAGLRIGAGRRVIELYSSMSCTDELPPFADRMAALDDPSTTEARFRALPAGLTYAVFGRVEGPDGVVVARACADGVQVMRDDETAVSLSFSDAPLAPEGRYEAVLALTATSSSAWASEVATDAGGALIDTAGGGADLYLDALEAELRERGATIGADALALERATGVPAATLTAALGGRRRGSAGRAGGRAGGAARAHDRACLERAALHRGGLRGAERLVDRGAARGGSSDPDSPALMIDPAAAGLELSPSLSLSWPMDDALVLESLTLALPLGTLARRTLEAEVAGRALGSPGELLATRGGCDALAIWIAEDPTVGPLCTADCPRAACLRALDSVMDAALGALDLLDEARDTVLLSGTLEMVDADGDLLVDQLSARELSGAWSGPTESDPLAGGLTAARSPE
ncbi:MAG: hypothetical protein M5U28_22900 [Sandaracinaceae bacterium]|nr:hypothetical protein [Sandaracinaceae bacterium]